MCNDCLVADVQRDGKKAQQKETKDARVEVKETHTESSVRKNLSSMLEAAAVSNPSESAAAAIAPLPTVLIERALPPPRSRACQVSQDDSQLTPSSAKRRSSFEHKSRSMDDENFRTAAHG